MATTLTIGREVRELLRREVLMFGSGGDISMAIDRAAGLDERHQGNPQEVRDMLAEANFTVALLDQLGWSPESERDEYKLDVNAEQMLGWLRRKASSLRETVGDDALTLRSQERGDEDSYYGHSSQDESVAHTRGRIDRELDALDAVLNLLRQLSGPAPTRVLA